jgi:hypothetical protein
VGAILVLLAGARQVCGQATPPRPAAGESASRAAEIQVELAWLADPLICTYYPIAHVAGTMLEVGGYVPDESTRLRVLQLARQYCPLSLVDRLRVNPKVAVRPLVQVTPEKLRQAALAALEKDFAECQGHSQVACGPAGQLTVAGPIRSLEQKLRVSQRLRRLPGCAGVINQMHVDPKAGSLAQAPPAPPPAPAPAVATPRTPPAAPAPPPAPPWTGSAPRPPASAPVALGPRIEPGLGSQAPAPAKAPVTPPGPASPYGPNSAQTSVSARTPLPPAPPPAVAPLVPAPPIETGPPNPGASPAKLPVPPPPSPGIPSAPSSAQTSVSARPQLPPAPPPPAPPSATTSPTPPPPPPPPPPSAVATPRTPPAPQPAVAAPRTPAPLGTPYISEGYVSVAPAEPDRRPVAKGVSPAVLQQRIKAACPEVLNVEVLPSAGTNLRIRLRLANQADADRVVGRIAVLPEMAGLNPAFDIQAGR